MLLRWLNEQYSIGAIHAYPGCLAVQLEVRSPVYRILLYQDRVSYSCLCDQDQDSIAYTNYRAEYADPRLLPDMVAAITRARVMADQRRMAV